MANLISMPKLGFDMAEGTLVRWLKSEGEPIEKGEVLAEIETDKATVEVESAHGGVVRRLLAEEGASLPVGAPIAVVAPAEEQIDFDALLGSSGEKAPAASPPALPSRPAAAPPAETPQGTGSSSALLPADGLPQRVKASPLARRMAAEHNLNLGILQGSGPGGRVVKRDIQAALAAPPVIVPAVVDSPSDQVAPVSRLRAAVGRRMVEAKQQVPHFYLTHEYDMEALLALRKQVNAQLAEEGEKISVNDFIVKAAALALREFPNLNASLQGEQVVRHGHVNMGVAVAVEGGLLTVVCREADEKPLRRIAAEIKEMATRARQGKVRPNDIQGSTFSVSNLGMYDVEHFIAIINPPEAGILAVGSARPVPVVRDGQVAPGITMKATLSVDHRVSDGAEAAQFMQRLAAYLENPLRLLL